MASRVQTCFAVVERPLGKAALSLALLGETVPCELEDDAVSKIVGRFLDVGTLIIFNLFFTIFVGALGFFGFWWFVFFFFFLRCYCE